MVASNLRMSGQISFINSSSDGSITLHGSEIKGNGIFSSSIIKSDLYVLRPWDTKAWGAVSKDKNTDSDPDENSHEYSFAAANAVFSGSLDFTGAIMAGPIDLTHIDVASDLSLAGIELEVSKTSGVECHGATIGGGVFLSNGCRIQGETSFHTAKISGSVLLWGGAFNNSVEHPQRKGWSSVALDFSNATIRRLSFDAPESVGPLEKDERTDCEIVGSIAFGGARIDVFEFREHSWPRLVGDESLRNSIELEGISIGRVESEMSQDAALALRFLRRGANRDKNEFVAQPYEEISAALRRMGHLEVAERIDIEREHLWRATRLKQMRPSVRDVMRNPMKVLTWPLQTLVYGSEWILVGGIARYGYSASRVLGMLALLWFGCGYFYQRAAQQGAFTPVNPVIYLNADLKRACSSNWASCSSKPEELSNFSPYLFSADVMLPGVDLGQDKDWQPVDRAISFDFGTTGEHTLSEDWPGRMMWMQTIISWIGLGLLILVFSSALRRK